MENVVKGTFGGDTLEIDIKKMKIFQFKFWHVIELINRIMTDFKKRFQNITPDFLKFKTYCFDILQRQIVTIVKFLFQKADHFEFFVSKSCFLKNQRKCKRCRFRKNMIQYVIFCMQIFSVSGTFQSFQFKVWHVV